MITAITAKQFKGLEFEQPIQKKTLFLGPNGAGKTARTQALTLALLGYIPGSGKTNDDILTNFGSSDLLSVGFELNKMLFQRAWQRTPAGKVGELFQIQGKRCTKDFYLQTLGEQGTPKILDLSLFLDLSSQKQIDYLLALYPSDTNLAGLEEMIENQKKAILLLEDKARSTEKAAAALTASRATMQLPTGSLAETTATIEKAEKDLEAANRELNEIITANAAEKAKVEAEVKAEADKKRAQEKADADKKRAELAAELSKTAAINVAKAEAKKESEARIEKLVAVAKAEFETAKEISTMNGSLIPGTLGDGGQTGIVTILQSILDTIDAAGCTVCAAKMVCKKEMKKYARN